jgi:hypothetical protein
MALTLLVAALVGLGDVLGAALLSWRTGRRFARAPAAFRCKVRIPDLPRRARAAIGADWGRRRTSAVWLHDVLLVRSGLFGLQVVAFPVRLPEEGPRPAPGVARRLGPDPYLLVLRLDDGRLVEVALPAQARVPAAGPFLAAAIPGLPAGPVERRPHPH